MSDMQELEGKYPNLDATTNEELIRLIGEGKRLIQEGKVPLECLNQALIGIILLEEILEMKRRRLPNG